MVKTKNTPYHTFPLDKEDTKYEAKITFTARKIKSFDVDFLFDAVGMPTKSIETKEDVISFDRRVEAQRLKAFNATAADTNTVPGSKQQFEGGPQGKATLYLPQAVQISDAATYDNIDLGVLGAGTQAGLQQGTALLPSLVDNVAGSVSSIIDTITGRSPVSKDVARLAVNRAAKLLPFESVRGAVSSATRVSVNPNTRALFKSVPLREFAFNFKMIPTSKAETEQIKGIIKFFRTELYPEVIPLGDINAGYKFPNVFEIKMFYGNDGKPLATKILPSYIKSFSATYNASTMGFYEGGDFSEVDISMSFVESSTLHKELVRDKDY